MGEIRKGVIFYGNEEAGRAGHDADPRLFGGGGLADVTVSGANDNTVNKSYNTLQEAFDAVGKQNLGNVTITLDPNTTIQANNDMATLNQSANTYILIKGDGKTTVVNACIKIAGYTNSASNKNCSITIENVIFDGTGVSVDGDYMLGSNKQNSDIRNLTVKGCCFTDDDKSMVGIKLQQGMGNTLISNCTAENMHSLFWGTGGDTHIVFDNVTVENSGRGIHTGTIKNVEVKNSAFDVEMHAVRIDLNNSYGISLKATNNTFDTVDPFIVRKTSNKENNQIDVSNNTYLALTVDQADQVVKFEDNATADMIKGEETAQDSKNNTFLNPAAYNSNSYVDLPQTGDNASLMLWSALLTLAMGGFVMMKKARLN